MKLLKLLLILAGITLITESLFSLDHLSKEVIEYYNEPIGSTVKRPDVGMFVASIMHNIIMTKNHEKLEELVKLFTNKKTKTLEDTQFKELIYELLFEVALVTFGLDLDMNALKILLKYSATPLQDIEKGIDIQEKTLKFAPNHLRAKKALQELTKLRKEYEEYLNYKKKHSDELLKETRKNLHDIPGLPESVHSFHELTFDDYLAIKEKESHASSSSSSSSPSQVNA